MAFTKGKGFCELTITEILDLLANIGDIHRLKLCRGWSLQGFHVYVRCKVFYSLFSFILNSVCYYLDMRAENPLRKIVHTKDFYYRVL